MALWNAPMRVPDHESQSVRAAIDMLNVLKQLNTQWKEQNLPALEIRIGINTANCLVGNLGCQYRVNYSVIGDGVNIA
jgi:adenylate cyclase